MDNIDNRPKFSLGTGPTTRRFKIPSLHEIRLAFRVATLKEQATIFCLIVVFLFGVLGLLAEFNNSLLVKVPARGGQLTEGIIGIPRFVNPILAASDADRDITALVYAGLMRVGEDGTLVPDLAQSYEISPDGLTYTFTLKEDIYWHDGAPITSEDIEFTIHSAQDPALKSPKRASWEGITVERDGDRVVRFRLKQPYSSFLENTAMGILPKHIWKNLNPDLFPLSNYNIEAIGSGPYLIKKLNRDSSGIPENYELSAFDKFEPASPFIGRIVVKFYPSEDLLIEAFKRGDIESMGAISPESVSTLPHRNSLVYTTTLPRIFAVFWNANSNKIFAQKSVRAALDTAVDKDQIVNEVLKGFGATIDSPLPSAPIAITSTTSSYISESKFEPQTLEHILTSATSSNTSATGTAPTPAQTEKLEAAKAILQKDGWKLNKTTNVWEKKDKKNSLELSFTLSTADSPELKRAASIIADTWRTLGAKVELKVYEIGDLNQNIIRPRKYDALFFGEIVGRDPDLFAFWHSSQRNDPGLNIATYTNIKVDGYLESLRKAYDPETRMALFTKIIKEIKADVPASFIYSPQFLYIAPKKIRGVTMNSVVTSSERFAHINNWYIETDKVWKIFLKQ